MATQGEWANRGQGQLTKRQSVKPWGVSGRLLMAGIIICGTVIRDIKLLALH